MNPKISIIVPVYNVEKYIQKCINSILNQEFKDFELLLINDGSTDISGKICNEYAVKDHRIRVFHRENRGPSAARNFGIKLAKGSYIGFVDSDDTINIKMYKEMYSLARENKYDVIVCGYKEINYETNKQSEFVDPLNGYKILEGNEIKENLEKLLTKNKILGYASLCNKLYNREVIVKKNILIKENIKIAEDLCFNLEVLSKINRIACINKSFYEYRRINSNSIMNDKSNLYLRFEAREEMLNVFRNLEISEEVYLKCLTYENATTVTSYIGLIKDIIRSKKMLRTKNILIKNLINEKYFIDAINNFDKNYLTYKVLIIIYIIKIYLKIKN